MENNSNGVRTIGLSGGTVGFFTFIVFLILKLTNTWDIDWFWVWFPLWLPFAIMGVFMLIAIVCALILHAIDKD